MKNINCYYYEEYIVIDLFIQATFLCGNFSTKHFHMEISMYQIQTEIDVDISLLSALYLI